MSTKKAVTWLLGITILIAIGVALLANNPSNRKQDIGMSPNQITGSSVDYSNHNLSHFPKEVLGNTAVETLNLSNNNLTGALPAEIRQLQNLQELNVSNNKMTGIPAEIGQLKKLQILNYANNSITGLPMELGNLSQLKVLDLSGNPNLSQKDLAAIKQRLPNTQIKV